jgi:hypothetical protein
LKFLYLGSFLFGSYVISKFLCYEIFLQLEVSFPLILKRLQDERLLAPRSFCSGISLFRNVLALPAFYSKIQFWNFAKFRISFLLILKPFKGSSLVNFIWFSMQFILSNCESYLLIELQNITNIFYFNKKIRKVPPTWRFWNLTNKLIQQFSN